MLGAIGRALGCCHASAEDDVEFSRDHFRDALKDAQGNDMGETAYAVEPRSFLVIGDMSELRGNDDKVACFELYRRHMRSPEIVTFDELYQRARCIVENISRETEAPNVVDDDMPF